MTNPVPTEKTENNLIPSLWWKSIDFTIHMKLQMLIPDHVEWVIPESQRYSRPFPVPK